MFVRAKSTGLFMQGVSRRGVEKSPMENFTEHFAGVSSF